MEDPFELVISTMKISSTVDINSKSLAMLFPPMERFLTIKDVIC